MTIKRITCDININDLIEIERNRSGDVIAYHLPNPNKTYPYPVGANIISLIRINMAKKQYGFKGFRFKK